jgi:hypothetical protein
MGLYRDEAGMLIEVDDRFAEARGYAPANSADHAAMIHEAGDKLRGEERGVIGSINAAATGALSGLTLGASDVLLANVLDPIERERLQAELEAHPYLRTGGEIVGAVAAGFAAPGSALAKTPAGYLGSLTSQQVSKGLAQGGARGVGRAIGAMGVEGAAQGAGQYVGHSAIEDKDLTAEGLAGSLGTGFAFGGVGGGAVLGVAKGAMSARRLYSRVMDGPQAAQATESSWTIARQEALDGDAATVRAAEIKLDEISKAKIEAQRYRNETKAATADERIRASAGDPRAGAVDDVAPPAAAFDPNEGPAPLADVAPQTGAGGVTSAYKIPEQPTFAPADAAAFDASMPVGRDQVNAVVSTFEAPKVGAKTGAFKRPEGSTARIVRGGEEAATDLEGQLAGTKARLDDGAALKDIKPIKAGKGNESDSIAGWLDEAKAYDDAVDAADLQGAAALRNRRMTTLREIRFKATEELLGPQMAKAEREIVEAVEEFQEARKAVEDLSDGIPVPLDGGEISRVVQRPNQTARATPRGKRQAVEIIDDAHEEALLRAKYGADPQEAGRAITEAEELENLLEQVADVSDGVPRAIDASAADMFGDQLAADIKKLWRYEEASAKLADLIADGAHPTSLQRAKLLREAEKDSARKVMDRSARAVDDAETFGPTYATPKERVQYARERQVDAQKNVDELGIQEKEARNALGKASKNLRDGEKAKKAALRTDAQALTQASKFGARDAGGVMEMLDLPGLPKPSDLPIVGPLLGAYLKFRTLKRAMGRAMGKVPATPDAKVAAHAAQTRDRIARAVDRSLGLVERGGKYASRKMPPVAGVLSNRIFDDGGEDPGPKAPIQKQAAARMRELAAYVHTPGAIERDVRLQLRGVVDPDLIASAEKHRRYMMEYILKHAPKMPEQGMIKTHDYEPSPGQAMSLARRIDALNDPSAVFERLAQERDLVSIEASESLREVYPRLFQEALQRAIKRSAEAGKNIPYRTRVQMSVFYQMPFEAALSPENFQITQSVFERKPSSPAYNPTLAPTPAPSVPQSSVAQPTNLSPQYMPTLDRRSQ